jgi:hypothetical protein
MCANMRDTSLLQTDSNQMVKFICGLLLQGNSREDGWRSHVRHVHQGRRPLRDDQQDHLAVREL